jgi:hypothetical protein
VSGDRDVTITLTDAQVARVVREASGRASLTELLSGVSGFEELLSIVRSHMDDVKCSRSMLRALLVLGAFPADGSERELTDVARQVGFSPSTTHRYVGTWMALGLLEQESRSRRYRRPPAHTQAADATSDGCRNATSAQTLGPSAAVR